jgi:hypothetical protein
VGPDREKEKDFRFCLMFSNSTYGKEIKSKNIVRSL